MATIKIVGKAVVLKSGIKLEDWQKVQKYQPNALVLKDAEGNETFRVAIGAGSGYVSKLGVSFSDETSDPNGMADVTLVYQSTLPTPENVMELFGNSILSLNHIEGYIPEVIAEVDAELGEIMSNITVE